MCSCDSGIDPEFQSWTYPRARKEYNCAECNLLIRVGERHEAFTQEWDGEVATHRVCGVCVRLRAAFHAVNDEDCNPPFWELRSCIRELVSERVTTWPAFRAACKAAKTVRQLRDEDRARYRVAS